MKKFLTLGHKVILLYTAMTLCATGVVSAMLGYWATDYDEELSYSYIEERVDLIARENLERFSDNKLYDAYIRHRKDAAAKPFATQIVLDADNGEATHEALREYLDSKQIAALRTKEEVRFKHGESLGVAMYCPKQEGNFIVIVTLNSHFGSYLYQHVGYWMFGIVGLCVLMVIIVSKLYTLRHIKTLNEAYQRERQFVHHASHELNNPLTAIQGECEITLMKPRTTGEYVESLSRIGDESRRMVQIIRQLLYLSSAMNGTGGDEKSLIKWADFLHKFTEDRRVRLTVEHGAAENVEILANPFLLKIAVGNIVRNSLKYSSEDVYITLSERKVTISDHGIGIPKADLSYVTQPFYRASNTGAYKGNGVGMSLAVNILRLYGITVKIKSKVSVGTTVELRWKGKGSD